jgi:hypothetical protein
MSTVNLPVITLRRGPWQVDLFDPRPRPNLLGARFIHGGYVARAFHDGREITGASDSSWYAYDGCGLPETFESGLAWHLVAPDEEFLRPGAGRLLKRADEPGEMHAHSMPLTATLEWEVEAGAERATFRTADTLRRRQQRIGYRLERTIALDAQGLASTTTFTLEAPIARQLPLPLTWYAHPFVRQTQAGATAFRLPDEAIRQADPPAPIPVPAGATRGEDGLWRVADNGRLAFAGLWGRRAPIAVHLQGGGILDLDLDRPLDHLVLWSNDRAASVEPKLAHAWLHGETATWTLRYRFRA